MRVEDAPRITALLNVAGLLDCSYGARALDQTGPHFLWTEQYLRHRADCYAAARRPEAERARRDLEAFLDR